ncbi:MAG: hypothetical protein NZU63_03955 [Gemmataceae bacterium]|nr:hypothetical protein [Gemmataceae bacterium]MDW8243188.1 hypothetical protein [Thermogemmata sp.]
MRGPWKVWAVASSLCFVPPVWGQASGPSIPTGTGPLTSPTAPPPPSPGVGIPTAGLPGQVIATSYQFSPPLPQPQPLPRVGSPVGVPLSSPLLVPYDPRRPLDPLRAAGRDTAPLTAPVQGYGDQSFFERFLAKIKAVFGVSTTPVAPPPNVTPGIFRRNRQAFRQRLWPID